MHPVPPAEAPDYYVIIKEPMYWKAIERKLADHTYLNLAEFLVSHGARMPPSYPLRSALQRDITLVLDNAIQYNIQPGNIYRKLAMRIQKAAAPVFASLVEEVRNLGAFPATASPEDMVLEAPEAAIRALKEPSAEEDRTLLEKLFTYELEPPRPPTPPPKPKQRVDKDEALARKQARAAKYDGPRIPGRSTRHTVAMGIDTLATEAPAPALEHFEDGTRRKSRRQAANAAGQTITAELGRARRSRTAEVGADDTRNTGRARRSKADGKPNGVTASGDLTSASSGEVVPLDKAERGVVGKETYSPLGPKERRERDKRMAMELVVEDLDSRADFKRFNVGWVLPEGTKRGGRRERLLEPVVHKKRKCERDPLTHGLGHSFLSLATASKVTDTSASSAVDARSTAEPGSRMSVDANDVPPPPATLEITSANQRAALPTVPRQTSPARSESSLSSLSELSDIPDSDAEADVTKQKSDLAQPSRTDMDVSSASPVLGTRIRKRTYDSDSDYLLPEHYKRPRLQSTSSKDKEITRKTAVQKTSTPTDSDTLTLSSVGDQSKVGMCRNSKDTAEQEEDAVEDDAEPDEDEERDERLASLRGTNGSTAVGKWQDPYPDGTLGEFRCTVCLVSLLTLYVDPQFGLRVRTHVCSSSWTSC